MEPHDCGILVDPRDVETLSRVIRHVLEDDPDAEAMGRRGREAVLEHYSWDLEGERLVAFYRSLLNGDRHPGAAAHQRVPC